MAKTKYPKPLPNFVLLKLPPAKKKGARGFIALEDREKDNRSWAQEGEVLAIGAFYDKENKKSFVLIDRQQVTVEIKVGDNIYFSSFTSHNISNDLVLVEYKNILGIKEAHNV